MDHFVGIDVSLASCAVCVVTQAGAVMREAKVACEPEALIGFLREMDINISGIGLEAGPLSQWLHRHLREAGFEAALMETRQVKGALKAMPIKTDRRDALGIAQLLRMGWFRPVHCKSVSAQELRALLGARRTLQRTMISIELSMRGMLRGFGLKLGPVTRRRLPDRARELAQGNEMLTAMVTSMLRGQSALRMELARLESRLRRIARADRTVRLMMTVPGVGAIVALQVKAGIDDPARFRSSKNVGPHFGLTPRREQSGERDVVGAISAAGDRNVRTALFQAATVMLYRSRAKSWLRTWGMQVAKRRGMKRAVVAVARRLVAVLHRMWCDGAPFRATHPQRCVPV
ncbi:IS110 family transposase [Paracoccus sp. (in: a-proteobacteria)]|uniref:IS110 family transposase n=1 Tax=Paracoccus sp. TaxID=267 RepID=UPI003A892C4E